jgi:ABC-type multidrug transport system permease subunit
MLAIVAALILGTFYWKVGDRSNTPSDVLAVLGAIFVSLMFIGLVSFQLVIPTFFMERPVMLRERSSRLYAVLPWVLSMEDVEIPWIVAQVPPLSHFCMHVRTFERLAAVSKHAYAQLYCVAKQNNCYSSRVNCQLT